MDDFVKRVLDSYDIAWPSEAAGDIIIDRKKYFSHPRVTDLDVPDPREILGLAERYPDAKVIRLHEMSFGEQVRTIANAKMLRGVHGAGLTHLLWLPEGSEIFEWLHPEKNVAIFQTLATWRPNIKYSSSSYDFTSSEQREGWFLQEEVAGDASKKGAHKISFHVQHRVIFQAALLLTVWAGLALLLWLHYQFRKGDIRDKYLIAGTLCLVIDFSRRLFL